MKQPTLFRWGKEIQLSPKRMDNDILDKEWKERMRRAGLTRQVCVNE